MIYVDRSLPKAPPPASEASKQVIIGIDVAKDALVTAHMEAATGRVLTRKTYNNDARGHRRLVRAAQRYDAVQLVMEATGSYHLTLAQTLYDAELRVSVVNPYQIKNFGRAQLRRTKTDKADAELIADYGRYVRLEPYTPPTPEQAQLRQLGTLIAQLTKQRTALKNLAEAQTRQPKRSPLAQRELRRQIRALDQSLERLEAEQQQLAQHAFAETYELARSVKGIGEKTAATLVAYVGDLSRFDDYRQVSAYMGLDPAVHESGTQARRAHISKQGNARLRTLLYMCAHSARKHNTTCRALYERLLARGKAKKVALIAVANKLIKQLFAVIKSGRAFDNHYAETRALRNAEKMLQIA
jgi:transposase